MVHFENVCFVVRILACSALEPVLDLRSIHEGSALPHCAWPRGMSEEILGLQMLLSSAALVTHKGALSSSDTIINSCVRPMGPCGLHKASAALRPCRTQRRPRQPKCTNCELKQPFCGCLTAFPELNQPPHKVVVVKPPPNNLLSELLLSTQWFTLLGFCSNLKMLF